MQRFALLALLAAPLFACGHSGPLPTVPSDVVGHCTYTNPFSHKEECREYLGAGWTTAAATDDCHAQTSTIVLGSACNYPATLGQCILNAGHANVERIWFPGNDATQCGSSQMGCEFFGGGVFGPSAVCAGSTSDASVPTSGLPVFRQPELNCRDPLPGEPAGHSANGQVCTWSAIAASTEEGRHFEDYASCEVVRTQRPYNPRPPADPPMRATPDTRLSDPSYVADLGWVRSQIEASACVCCHSQRLAPNGPSNWFIDSPGNWMDTFYNSGLALGAGWIDSSSFGAYAPEHNNGFSRGGLSGVPSTDPARMARFFQNELASRGVGQSTFAGATPFGGPIYDEMGYHPTDCTGNEGVTADGTVQWSGGGARYVYVLEAGSANPTVPPNLDLPMGTIWRIDVPWTGTPINSGIHFGQLPAGTTQRFPDSGAPAALVNAHHYYLYVLQDVGIPITRCNFTYPR